MVKGVSPWLEGKKGEPRIGKAVNRKIERKRKKIRKVEKKEDDKHGVIVISV